MLLEFHPLPDDAPLHERLQRLFRVGFRQAEIAEEIGVGQSTVAMAARAIEPGKRRNPSAKMERGVRMIEARYAALSKLAA
jgi:hypothetical protein